MGKKENQIKKWTKRKGKKVVKEIKKEDKKEKSKKNEFHSLYRSPNVVRVIKSIRFR